MITAIRRALSSPYTLNRTGSHFVAGGVVALITYKCTTTSKIATTLLESIQAKQDDESLESSYDKNLIYKPKCPYPEWDHDWDDFQCRVSDAASSTVAAKSDMKLPTRHILLIRHGQYEQGSADDNSRILTELGQQQAKLTGQRLASMINVSSTLDNTLKGRETTSYSGPCYIKSLHVSNMARAKETAELIIKELHHSGHDMVRTEPDILLNEGLPAPIIPYRPDVGTPQQLAKEIHENHDRIEEAFQKYFYRKVPSIIDDTSSSVSSSDIDHEFEVIVCHANVIRYFVMRALQLPPEAWLRLSLFNCSITYLIVQPNGYVTARLIGDTGHIPYEATTFSGSFGYNWVGPPSVAK